MRYESETVEDGLSGCLPPSLVDRFVSDFGNNEGNGRVSGCRQDSLHRSQQSRCQQAETGTEGAVARKDRVQSGDVSLAIARHRASLGWVLRDPGYRRRWLL